MPFDRWRPFDVHAVLNRCSRRLQKSVLGAVSMAKNPFIPGMNLSVAFAVAARRAVEGDKRGLLLMQVSGGPLMLLMLLRFVAGSEKRELAQKITV